MMKPEGYARWRATVPFSDEEIAAQFDLDAATFEADGNTFMANRFRYRARRVRAGFLAAFDLRQVLGALVKTCAICGKKALYRVANTGRCSVHRMIPDKYSVQRVNRLERNGSIAECEEKDKARSEEQHSYARTARKYSTNRK